MVQTQGYDRLYGKLAAAFFRARFRVQEPSVPAPFRQEYNMHAATSASDNDEEDGDDEATNRRDTAFPSNTVRMYTDATWPYRCGAIIF
jgi:hypothetical protein